MMSFERISIKSIIVTMLLGLGVAVMALSLFMTQKFRQASLEFQEQSLQRMVESAAQVEIRTLEKRAAEVGEFALKEKSFKGVLGKLVKSRDEGAKQEMVDLLTIQFNQRMATTGYVDLQMLRLYDKELKLLVQASEKFSTLPVAMTPGLHALAAARKGADRMKRIGGLWAWDERPVHSTLIPVGGLRLAGYLEIVTGPIQQLKDLSEKINVPVRLASTAGAALQQSDNWPTGKLDNSLEIDVQLTDLTDRSVMRVQVVEDLTHLNEKISAIQWQIVVAFAVLIGVGVLASLWILRKMLFLPVRETVTTMERIAGGDLTVQPEVRGLKEFTAIIRTLNTLTDSIRNNALGVNDISQQLLDQANSLENVAGGTTKGITDLQDELSHIASAMTEMVATVEEVARNANAAASAASQADHEARDGRGVVAQTITVIEALAGKVDSASAVIARLAQDSDNIGAVLDVIKGIAEQTNLLALNAAIEAARAGEQGRGFAVVADEVRTLASRTQQSTREIQEMIERLQGGAEEAVKEMEESRKRAQDCVEQAGKTGVSLETIAQAVGTINDMNTQIASAAEEHSAVASEINGNVTNMGHVVEMSAEGASHTKSASEQLLQLSEQLRCQCAHFKL